MSYKAKLFRFSKTFGFIMDLRTDAATQQLEAIRRKALSHMMRTKAFGRARFDVAELF